MDIKDENNEPARSPKRRKVLATRSMDVKDEDDEKPARLQEVFEQLWELDGDDDEELGDLDKMTARVKEILKGNMGNASSSKELEDCFNSYDKKKKQDEENKELVCLEGFISTEQALGRQRRSEARKLEAIEEMRLAVEIAQLKGVRMRQQLATTHEEVQLKISDAEQSFLRRKMVFAKAAQVASAECRLQFARVREFYDKLHNTRQELLRRQHKRTLQFQEITHRLCGTDARVVSLDQQITNRLYQKKKADLNEVHMAQTLEEAVYLESMMDVKPMPNERITARCSWPLRHWRWPNWWLGTPRKTERTRKTKLSSVKRWMRWSGERISMPRRSASCTIRSSGLWPRVSLASPGPVCILPT
jgi:hypothetical protein